LKCWEKPKPTRRVGNGCEWLRAKWVWERSFSGGCPPLPVVWSNLRTGKGSQSLTKNFLPALWWEVLDPGRVPPRFNHRAVGSPFGYEGKTVVNSNFISVESGDEKRT
jgi:hypothetical protein